MPDIHINYDALAKPATPKLVVTDDLLKKAKGLLGFNARKELVRLFDHQLRVLAVEIAARQANPHALYEAGTAGLLEALKMYEVGQTTQPFTDFAIPFVRTSMLNARDKAAS